MAYESDNTFKRAYANQIGQGKGEAYVHEDFGKEARAIGMKMADNDYAKIEEAEKKRILYGEDSQIDLEGWDVDMNTQLAEELQGLQNYYADNMGSNVNPLDPKNREQYREYHRRKTQLMSDMKSSTGQKENYTKAMAALVADKKTGADAKWDYDKSMAALSDYRSGKISERELKSSGLLVPRIATGDELLDELVTKATPNVNETQIYDPETDLMKNNTNTYIDGRALRLGAHNTWLEGQKDPATKAEFEEQYPGGEAEYIESLNRKMDLAGEEYTGTDPKKKGRFYTNKSYVEGKGFGTQGQKSSTAQDKQAIKDDLMNQVVKKSTALADVTTAGDGSMSLTNPDDWAALDGRTIQGQKIFNQGKAPNVVLNEEGNPVVQLITLGKDNKGGMVEMELSPQGLRKLAQIDASSSDAFNDAELDDYLKRQEEELEDFNN